MSNRVSVRNRQHTRSVNSLLVRAIARSLLLDLLAVPAVDLAIYLVAATEMTRLNEGYLRHRGSTDVLAFDYSETGNPKVLCGEIFVCVDEALVQAARFNTRWQRELVRYVVHGTLHLMGYDDHRRDRRRKMKQQEDRLLKELTNRFDLMRLEQRASPP